MRNGRSGGAGDEAAPWRSRSCRICSLAEPDDDATVGSCRRCSSAHPPAYATLRSSGGGAADPACRWLYDTVLFPDLDLRLASALL